MKYVYDTLNRLQTLTAPSAFGTGNFGFTYDALSRRTQLTRPNSVTTTYGYDDLSRLLNVTHKHGATTIDGTVYTVDAVGNRKTLQALPSNTTSTFTYDAIYQLTKSVQGATTKETYTYDVVGNRLSSLGVSPYAYNSSNELTSKPGVTYTYDNNGNTLTKTDASGVTHYNWDFENRLTSVQLPASGGTDSFKYDPFGRRIQKSSTSATSVYAYDGDNLVEETNATGTVQARYEQGLNIDEPLAVLRSAVTSYYEQDGLGSTTSLSNSAGSAANTYTYDSFGVLTASTGSLINPFRYTAREFDSETNLYYYRARYYDPTAGRFLSEDPLQFRGGQASFYPYVGNDPSNWIDPRGWIHQGLDGKLHDDPAGGLEVLCRNNRNKASDIKMLETSILVRTAELAKFGDDANQGHIDRLEAEEETLARCRECDKEKPLAPRDVPVVVPDWKKWLERNRTPVLVTGAVVAGAAAIALAPVTGGASLLVFVVP